MILGRSDDLGLYTTVEQLMSFRRVNLSLPSPLPCDLYDESDEACWSQLRVVNIYISLYSIIDLRINRVSSPFSFISAYLPHHRPDLPHRPSRPWQYPHRSQSSVVAQYQNRHFLILRAITRTVAIRYCGDSL